MALTPNQVNDAVQSQLGRPATDYETTLHANSSPQTIASLGQTHAALNPNSIVDYLTSVGQDPSLSNRVSLGAKYGITNIGSAEGNTALLQALKSGATPPSSAPVQGTVTPNSETPTDVSTTIPGSVSTESSTPDPAQDAQNIVDQAYAAQQSAQKAVAAIDDTLSQTLNDKKAEIARSGGVVNESQLQSEVYQENQPLLEQRKQLVSEYTSANQAYQKSLSDRNTLLTQANRTAQLAQGQEKIDTQADQFTQKLEQAGWKQTKENVYDEYGNVTGQTTVWSQNPSNGGTPTGNNSGLPANDSSGNTTTGSHAAANIAPSGLTDFNMPLSQVISKFGINTVVNGIIQNEGGSLPGVQNNPGNIKFAGLPGQTDSGVSNDGGKSTFANYASADAGKQAIASIVQNAANGKSGAYGANPTFQDFVNKYTNTTPNTSPSGAVSNSNTPATIPLDTSASVNIGNPGYTTSNVTYNGKDTQLTQSYIDQIAIAAIMAGGTVPSSVSRATKGLPIVQMNAIKARMGQLDPGGNLALNKTEAAAWGKALQTQIAYATTLQRSLNSADADFKQILQTYTGTGINDQSVPISNIMANASKYNLGNGDVSAFKASLAELANAYQQVFSRSGAVTESVRAQSQDILDGNISIANLQKVSDQLQNLGKIDLDQANKTVSSAEQSYRGIVPGGNQDTGAVPTSGIPKGDQSDSDFVESSLEVQGISYNDFMSQVPSGQKAVIDNTTGAVGTIDPSEYDPSKYTSL